MDKELFEQICKDAEANKNNKQKLHQIFQFLKANMKRLSEIEKNFALEMLDNYWQECEAKEEVAAFMKKNAD